jgi:hypothetical protein
MPRSLILIFLFRSGGALLVFSQRLTNGNFLSMQKAKLYLSFLFLFRSSLLTSFSSLLQVTLSPPNNPNDSLLPVGSSQEKGKEVEALLSSNIISEWKTAP